MQFPYTGLEDLLERPIYAGPGPKEPGKQRKYMDEVRNGPIDDSLALGPVPPRRSRGSLKDRSLMLIEDDTLIPSYGERNAYH